jgi:hypothetical protein
VISVDAKQKELVGDCKHGGRAWQPTGEPEAVRVYDFKIPELGRVTPYGVYDLAANAGWVSVGIDHDTAAFAVASIGRWWEQAGRPRYPQAQRLLITAAGGGSNGARNRLWKRELQRLADQTGLAISGCHFPPGTSKWNKMQRRARPPRELRGRGRSVGMQVPPHDAGNGGIAFGSLESGQPPARTCVGGSCGRGWGRSTGRRGAPPCQWPDASGATGR